MILDFRHHETSDTVINTLSAKLTKWSNTHLSVFEHFVWLELKGWVNDQIIWLNELFRSNYCVSFNKRAPDAYLISKPLMNGAFWKAVLQRGRCLLQRKKSYSYEILKISHCLFSDSNKLLPLWFTALYIPVLHFFFSLFHCFILNYNAWCTNW